MRKEVFGIKSKDDDKNLLPLQQQYAEERRRDNAVLRGKLDRPFCSIGYSLAPHLLRLARTTLPSFVSANDARVVMLMRPYRHKHAYYDKTVVDYPSVTAVPWIANDGTVRVGGTKESVIFVHNYALYPYRDSQTGSVCKNWYGDLKCFKRGDNHNGPEPFVIRRDQQYLYLCVGRDSDDREPLIQYRFVKSDVLCPTTGKLLIEITPERNVSPDEVLATLPRVIPYERAEYLPNGNPKFDHRPFGSVNASRHQATMMVLNKALKEQNDRILLTNADHAPFRESHAPRMYVELPRAVAENLRNQANFAETAWLKKQILEAVGMGPQMFYVRATCDGVLESISPSETQPHLTILKFVDGRVQPIPSTTVLTVKTGDRIEYNQAIGDLCERHLFQSWTQLEEVLGPHRDHYLVPKFLEEHLIKPGQNGWSGPGYLCDVRIAQPIMRANMRLVWDFRPCTEYFDDKGHCVLPPFYQDEPVDALIQGIEYLMSIPDKAPKGRSGGPKKASHPTPAAVG